MYNRGVDVISDLTCSHPFKLLIQGDKPLNREKCMIPFFALPFTKIEIEIEVAANDVFTLGMRKYLLNGDLVRSLLTRANTVIKTPTFFCADGQIVCINFIYGSSSDLEDDKLLLDSIKY